MKIRLLSAFFSKIKHRTPTVILWICVSVLLLRGIQLQIADVCCVPSDSMEDTIFAGDCLLVHKTRSIARNDIIIFNHPNGSGTQLIKRCVGLPGDTVTLHEGQVYTNGEIVVVPPTIKIPFTAYSVNFPHQSLGWTTNNYGPVIVPFRGMTINLDSINIELYRNIIQFEGHEISRRDSVIYIDGHGVAAYTFDTNSYFVLGDNRGNSFDSRYWGFVAQELIVGKAILVYFSKDAGLKQIRWNRLFKKIR